jgi:hypothetical protein
MERLDWLSNFDIMHGPISHILQYSTFSPKSLGLDENKLEVSGFLKQQID